MNKRTVGITIIGFLSLATGALIFFRVFPQFFGIILLPYIGWGFIFNHLYILSWLIAGWGVLGMKPWAVSLVRVLSTLGAVGSLYGMWIFPVFIQGRGFHSDFPIALSYKMFTATLFVYYMSFVYFFSRPHIIERFKRI